MPSYWILILVIPLFILYTIYNSYNNTKKIKELIISQWGKPPVEQRNDKLESISEYWMERLNHKDQFKYLIDDLTWSNLDMDDVFKRLNTTFSSVGSECLYSRLHEPLFETDELNSFEDLLQNLDKSKTTRERISFYLVKIGKMDYNGVYDFLFSPESKRLAHSKIFNILAFLPLASVLSSILIGQYAIVLLIISSLINLIVYYTNKPSFETQLESIAYISRIVQYSGRITKLKEKNIQLHLDKISELYDQIKKVASLSNIIVTRPLNEFGFLLEIIKAVFMFDFISYNRIVTTICRKKEVLHRLWLQIGRIDIAICIASYRRSISYYCIPGFVSGNEISAAELYHPLVQNPIVNPVTLKRNALITGSNASGKSTYIKAVAINILFSQTIHTCLAKSFIFKPSLIITSMAVNENIINGESYFIAEIKSLKRILTMLNNDIRCVCFIDEILKGTNTIERIAASASILKWLSGQNCLCVAATHDIELTEILEDIYDNYHFREQISSDGITFDYKLHTGRATTKNAINLLDYLGYPKEIVDSSKLLASNLENQHERAI